MSKVWKPLPLFCLLFFSASPLLQAQGQSAGGGRHTPGGIVIDVRVRNPNGTPGPRGIHVRLESAEGGAEDDQVTTDGGKCEFKLNSSGVYMVRITEPHFKPVSERVELIAVSRAYVAIELRPLTDEQPGDAAGSSSHSKASTVTLGALGIPQKAQEEFDKGDAALRAKDLSQAVKHFEKAAKLFDNYPAAYRMLGEAYLESQDWKKSEEAFKKPLEIHIGIEGLV